MRFLLPALKWSKYVFYEQTNHVLKLSNEVLDDLHFYNHLFWDVQLVSPILAGSPSGALKNESWPLFDCDLKIKDSNFWEKNKTSYTMPVCLCKNSVWNLDQSRKRTFQRFSQFWMENLKIIIRTNYKCCLSFPCINIW